MSELRIITNNVPQFTKYYHELTPAQQSEVDSNYDWMGEEEKFYGWIDYRNRLYHLSDFLVFRDQSNNPFVGWDGYMSDSFFSGVLIKFPCDYDTESVIMGWYFS